MKQLTGMGVAIVTPFKEDLSVDFDALKKIVRYNIDNGTNYIVISGTTGESVTITKQEKKQIIDVIIEENNGKLPLVLGIGGNNTQAVIDELKTTDLSKIDAILSVSPYYSKPTQEGIYQHYKAISEATDKPIILYNVPGRTGKNMEVETIIRLANDFKNIVAVKEAGGNLSQYYQLIKQKPKDFIVLSGDDDLCLATTLAGGSGVISVIGQAYPKEFSQMIKLALAGKVNEAYELHYKIIDMIGLIFAENNPAGIKAVLNHLDLCNDTVRLPLVPASDELKSKISNEIKRIKN